MVDISLQEICKAIDGHLTQEFPELRIHDISIDSRKIIPGSLFIAIQGEKFDGHDFVNAAIAAGAAAVIISREIPPVASKVAVIRVKNTLDALGQIAAFHRSQFQVPLIGITGSNGKTTTKDLVASILRHERKVIKTEANFNNEIGLPLTLFKMDQTTQVAVVEMGMRGLGQIRHLAGIARPTIGVVTNVGLTHLELLGTQENIAKAKTELVQSLPSTGLAVLNGDDPWVRRMKDHTSARTVYYGVDTSGLDYRATDIREKNDSIQFQVCTQDETLKLTLPMPGRHNVLNALAAIAVAKELGISNSAIVRGLTEPDLTGKRLKLIRRDGYCVIDDTYNASPASVRAALDVLSGSREGNRKIAVLADMLELGPQAGEIHHQLGQYAADHGVDQLFAFGDLARRYVTGYQAAGVGTGRHFDNKDHLIAELLNIIKPGDVILVKGSRSMKMEEVVAALTKEEAH